MSLRQGRDYTPIERKYINKIRRSRDAKDTSLLDPPRYMHDEIILDSMGNFQLRLSVIAKKLGTTQKTLEREFTAKYRISMHRYQVEVRLEAARRMLAELPSLPLAEVASVLGYDRVQNFNRFFKRETGRLPRALGASQ